MLSELFYPYLLGGAEKRYYEIAKRLAKRHRVTVYSLRLPGTKAHEFHENIEIRRVGLRHPSTKRSFLPLLSYFPALLMGIQHQYDIIDCNQ